MNVSPRRMIPTSRLRRRTQVHRRRRALQSSSSPSPCIIFTIIILLLAMSATRTVVNSLPNNPRGGGNTNDDDSSNDDAPSTSTSSSVVVDTITSKEGSSNTKIFTNLSDNYQSSSTSLDAVTKKLEDDFKERQLKLREYWQQTFEEIKASNPVVFPPEEDDTTVEEDDVWTMATMQRWKLFSDASFGSSGGMNSNNNPEMSEVDQEVEKGVSSIDNRGVDGGSEGTASGGDDDSRDNIRSKSRMLLPTPPLRFDGFQTWEKQLQQWSDDVSMYLAETESQINELLQPKEPSSTYDMSSFGISSESLKRLIREDEDEEDAKRLDTKVEKESDADEQQMEPKSSSTPTTTTPKPTKRSLSQRLGLISSSVTTPIGTLPITLTNFDRTLPPIPKPRPITSTDTILPHTDIGDKSKNIWIVTTGALPWMTGTAVNPLLRAAYLSNGRRDAGGSVTLMLPWVERPSDQKRIYGSENRFSTPEDQEEYIRGWLRDTANMKMASTELNIRWYTAWQEVLENSLYSMGDIIGLIPEEECDICVLEEPEHLNWYRAPGENWTSKFKHVVGIVHTNYFVYATEQPAAFIRAPGMRLLTSWMCRAHCHRVIKLSGTLQQFAPEKELVENVHGVRRTFLDIGEELGSKLQSRSKDIESVFSPDATPTAYFIGKMLWSKGLGSLMDLMKYAEESAGLKIKMDMYGGGPNKDEASEKAKSMGLDMPFHGPIDHAELGWTHKVFINPSLSEVLCTTVAEALAMGKFVVLPSHPSNDFFAQFPNCLPYTNKEEFVGNLYYALTHSPEPLTDEFSHALSWEAATDRFVAAGSISAAEAEAMEEALSSAAAGIDIDLPPLAANEKQRELLSRSFSRTRARYRGFRSKLSQEISKTNVLPKDVQLRLISELDKRLDVNLDELLDSPKLRVKLSPAKLDKLLLELYDNVTKGPSGDVLRVIGGGANVGRQAQYIKQQQRTASMQDQDNSPILDFTSFASNVAEASTPTSLVKRALKRNFPQKRTNDRLPNGAVPKDKKAREVPKMTLVDRTPRFDASWGVRMIHQGSFTRSLPPKFKYSPLI